jgi:hypothetical protein
VTFLPSDHIFSIEHGLDEKRTNKKWILPFCDISHIVRMGKTLFNFLQCLDREQWLWRLSCVLLLVLLYKQFRLAGMKSKIMASTVDLIYSLLAPM